MFFKRKERRLSPRAEGNVRIDNIVDEFRKQITELESGIDQVDSEIEGNRRAVQDGRDRQQSMEARVECSNADLLIAKNIATSLKDNIRNLITV